MNTYLDKHIAFKYPPEYKLYAQEGYSYSLSKGRQLRAYTLPDDMSWDLLKKQFLDLEKIEKMNSHRPIGGPTQKNWLENYDNYGFSGKGIWTELISPKGKLQMKGLHLFVERGGNELYLRLDDYRDFNSELIDECLEHVFFPNEPEYATFQVQASVEPVEDLQFNVSLPHLSRFGDDAQSRKLVNVQYEGDEPTDVQISALSNLKEVDKELAPKILQAAFEYYNDQVVPVLQKIPMKFLFGIKAKPLKKLPEVTPLISLAGIVVHEARQDGQVPIGLRFDCDWDEEHGLGIRVVGPEIEAVGTDYVALDPDSSKN